MKKDDWRLMGQERYLMGKTLRYGRFIPRDPRWDHEHCAFCTEKFDAASPEAYYTVDEERCICRECYDDLKERFGWKMINNASE